MLFSFDSPAMHFIGKVAEYIIVSILCAIFCIPVITAGAAITAKYYVGMKLVRGEEPAFFKAYIKGFKENFKQATIIWLIEMAVGAFFAFDWYLIISVGGENFNQTAKILLAIVTLFLILVGIAVFPLIARFKMSTKEAIKGAFVYTYINVPRMLCVLALIVILPFACWKYAQWLMAVWPIGSAVSLYLISYNFVKSFKKLEDSLMGDESDEADIPETEMLENEENN